MKTICQINTDSLICPSRSVDCYINLHNSMGASYSSFVLEENPETVLQGKCQSACRNDSRCNSWALLWLTCYLKEMDLESSVVEYRDLDTYVRYSVGPKWC